MLKDEVLRDCKIEKRRKVVCSIEKSKRNAYQSCRISERYGKDKQHGLCETKAKNELGMRSYRNKKRKITEEIIYIISMQRETEGECFYGNGDCSHSDAKENCSTSAYYNLLGSSETVRDKFIGTVVGNRGGYCTFPPWWQPLAKGGCPLFTRYTRMGAGRAAITLSYLTVVIRKLV